MTQLCIDLKNKTMFVKTCTFTKYSYCFVITFVKEILKI